MLPGDHSLAIPSIFKKTIRIPNPINNKSPEKGNVMSSKPSHGLHNNSQMAVSAF